MPDTYTVNQTPTGYGFCTYLLVTMLTGAGWVIKSSGDGLSAFSATTSVFSNTGATGANGLGNNLAWFRIQDPGGGREFVLQRNSTQGVRIKYSATAKFTGGTPSTTQVPSATDEQILAGGGTDAAPTFHTTWLSTNANVGTEKFQGKASSSAPYGFWFAGLNVGSTLQTALMMDPVSGDAADTDPVVWHLAGTGNSPYQLTGLGTGSTGSATTVFNACFLNVARTAWVGVAAAAYNLNASAIQISATNGAVNPFSGSSDMIPIIWYRESTAATAQGFKGYSTLMRWTMVAKTLSIDTANTKTFIAIGAVWLPWDGVSVPSA